jgi:CRP-like cAMP-binding protein
MHSAQLQSNRRVGSLQFQPRMAGQAEEQAWLHSWFARSDFLSKVPECVASAWMPNMSLFELKQGACLHHSKEAIRYVTFPIDGVVAVIGSTPTGDSAMMAIVGREGCVGLPAVMNGHYLHARAVVLLPGVALRLDASAFLAAFNDHSGFRAVLMSFMQASINQVGSFALCNRHCKPEGQLCTLLLRAMDRKSAAGLEITQERLAQVLGWRRETVSLALSRLQAKGVIQHRRGHIGVDRLGAEAQCCTCYPALQRCYTDSWVAPSAAPSAPAVREHVLQASFAEFHSG